MCSRDASFVCQKQIYTQNGFRLKSVWWNNNCAPCARLKLERKMMNGTILKYIKEMVYLYMCTRVCVCMWEVLSGVSFWLCVLNSPDVCRNPVLGSSSSPSWYCDVAGGNSMDVCFPLCPSLKPSAWRRKKSEQPNQFLIINHVLIQLIILIFIWHLIR